MLGAVRDPMNIIGNGPLEVLRTVTPRPGKTAAHVQFDKE